VIKSIVDFGISAANAPKNPTPDKNLVAVVPTSLPVAYLNLAKPL
jgi:hypothetical protein